MQISLRKDVYKSIINKNVSREELLRLRSFIDAIPSFGNKLGNSELKFFPHLKKPALKMRITKKLVALQPSLNNLGARLNALKFPSVPKKQ